MAKVNFADISTTDIDDDALFTFTSGEKVLNFGNLTTEGDLADGIFAGANDVSIRHFRNIETSGLGAAGIFVQGENARIENFGSVVTHGDFFGDFEFFSEGIFALGDRFYIANHGNVRVEGESSSTLVGVGADGLVVNFNVVDSLATGSSVIAAFGDRSQVINRGQMTVRGDDNGGLFVLGEDASALNTGRIVITGASNVGIEGVESNTHITNRGIISITADNGTGMGGFGDGHQVSNFGLIETHGDFTFGMAARGGGPLELPGEDLDIVNAARIATEGHLGIGISLGLGEVFGLGELGFNPAEGGQIENRRVIETNGDGAAGVVMTGNGHHLTNSGRITTDGGTFSDLPLGQFRAAGVVVSGDDALVENTRTGIIRSANADSAAIELNVFERPDVPAADMSSTLENFGLIEGALVAVLGGDGQETVINHGRIVGDVDLGGGDDTFVFAKGGDLTGDLFLGGGDDFVLIENGAGNTNIADFAGGDVIDVSAFFSSLGELTATAASAGNDVVVALDNNDTLVLADLELSALNAGDFFFV